jgi:cytochrome c oxidase subunit 3
MLSAVGVLGSTTLILLVGTVITLFGLMGWGHQVIKEKPLSHDLDQQQKDLFFFTKLFLVSELAAFGAIFGYFFYRAHIDPIFHPPEGMHLGGPLVGLATFLLLSSSVTCEMSHHALLHGQKGRARMLLLSTLILGVIFLGFQGYEYGLLMLGGYGIPDLAGHSTNAFVALFYIATGFHGFHVLTGLVMLALVYVRLEMGHFSKDRHFSFMAASLYWHFVDIVWILLFITVYVISPTGAGH